MMPKRVPRQWLVYGVLAFTIGAVAVASLLVGGGAPVPASAVPPPLSAPTVRAITPRLPSNATLRTTPTPIPSVMPATSVTTDVLDTLPSPQPLPTWSPLAPDSPEPLPPLVFARRGQIWISDGSEDPPTQLTTLEKGTYAGQPDIAPDGETVAFVALIPAPITATLPLPSSKLFTIRRDGSQLQEVWAFPEGILWLPSWSPDGKAIYLFANSTYTAKAGEDTLGRLQIVRFHLETGETETLVVGALDPTVSHDGSQLAYLKFDDDAITMHLEVADPDGNAARRVIDGAAFEGLFAPRFSPDGQEIVVAAIGGPETDDQGYPLTRSEQNPLDAFLGLLEPPSAEAHGAPWDLWIVKIDGTGLRRLTSIYEDLPMAVFSPDGSEIVIMGYNGFYQMNADGSNLRRISPDGDHGGVDWVPNVR